ncbi:MAG: hypothetical protein ACI8QZ_002949, partial [Chlamydiales bacterium]
ALNYGSQKAAQDTLAGAGAARGPMDKA